MKKVFLFTVALALAFSACQKYDVSEPVSADKMAKATVSGVVYANTDLTNTDKEFAPAGTKLKFTASYSDLGITTNTGTFAAETTVQANGTYSISLPAKASDITYTISCEDFVADEVNRYKTVKKIFTATSDQSVKQGFNYVKNIDYAAGTEILSTVYNWTEKGKFETKLEYVRDASTGTKIEVPTGTKVIVTIAKAALGTENDKVFEVSVETGGKITIEHLCPPLTANPNYINITLSTGVLLPVKIFGEDSYKVFSIQSNATHQLQAGYTNNTVKSILLSY
ncbi:MAG: hypothetical protein LBS07_04645 [Prevotellaceae bacterium]|jgi:hypothetical protein|nr:hypothetical protein [Prevotellaceae bacterium]